MARSIAGSLAEQARGDKGQILLMRVTRIGAICSLLLASAAGLGLALWPCAYRGVEAAGGGVPERQFCESLVEANGMSVLGVLVLPVGLAASGWSRSAVATAACWWW